MLIRRLLLSIAFALLWVLPAAAAELVMVEQKGCSWCARWDAEIAPIYPKTHEGKFAPLRRIDIRTVTDELQINRPVSFTPTFLLVDQGRELARLEGYPGEDFFWPLLERLLVEYTEFRIASLAGG